jgi:hypothetical protein
MGKMEAWRIAQNKDMWDEDTVQEAVDEQPEWYPHAMWMGRHLGMRVEGLEGPAKARRKAGEAQVPALPPGALAMMAQYATEEGRREEDRVLAATVVIMGIGCLRAKHVQRSYLLKIGTNMLYGVCLRGKNKPGYKWAAPRFFHGRDVGQILWRDWISRSLGEGGPRPYLAVDSSGHALTTAQITRGVRGILEEKGVAAEVFSSRSLRRMGPTIGPLVRMQEDEVDALGDWESKKNSVMRVRYADNKEHTARVAKTVMTRCLEIVVVAGGNWSDAPLALARVSLKDMKKRATKEVLKDKTEEETPQEWLQREVHMKNEEPVTVADMGKQWARARKLVHWIDKKLVPQCWQRKGEKKPLKYINEAGAGDESLQMCLERGYTLCGDCARY